MDPAPDLVTLFDFESAIEPAVQARLLQVGIGAVDVRQGKGTLLSGRVDVGLKMEAATGHFYVPANLPDGPLNTRNCFEDAWHATLTFSIITEREQNGQLHRSYVARVRALMLRFFTQFPEDLLPYHALSLVTTAGTAPGLMSAQNEDVTQLRYACVVSIRDGAWPAPY